MTPEQIMRLDGIKEGKRVCVSFHQGKCTVAIVDGRWLQRDPPTYMSWEVRSPLVNGRAFILPTDKVTIEGARSVSRVCVYLGGHRISKSRPNFALFQSGLIDRKATAKDFASVTCEGPASFEREVKQED